MTTEPKRSRHHRLVVEIEVPAGVSDDEMLETIKHLSLDADALQRALGGHGLMVESVEIYEIPEQEE